MERAVAVELPDGHRTRGRAEEVVLASQAEIRLPLIQQDGDVEAELLHDDEGGAPIVIEVGRRG